MIRRCAILASVTGDRVRCCSRRSCRLQRCVRRPVPLDRDRRHRRRLLPVRRRPREGPQREPARRPRDGGSHGRVGRQPEAHSRRPGRHRLHAGRHAGRCGRGPRRVRGPARAGGEPRRALLQLHARRRARRSSGIRTIADLRGKVVSTGSPGSGTEIIAIRMLRAAGLDPDRDVTRQGLGVSESAGALKDGKIAAFFWSGGLPTAAVQDLAHTSGHHHPHDSDRRPGAARCSRSYGAALFPADRFPPAATRASTQPCRSSASPTCWSSTRRCPKLAYDITRVLFEKQPELAGIHPEARNLSLDRGGRVDSSAVPSRRHPVLSREAACGSRSGRSRRARLRVDGADSAGWAAPRRGGPGGRPRRSTRSTGSCSSSSRRSIASAFCWSRWSSRSCSFPRAPKASRSRVSASSTGC